MDVNASHICSHCRTTPRPTKPVPLPQPTHPVKKRCAEESDAESEVSGSDAEASYERDIRMFDKKTIRKDAASSDKLPIKTGIHGGWKMDDSAAAVSDHEAETENDDSDSDDFTFDAEEVRAPKPAPAPRKSDAEAKPTDFAGKKRAIALLATAIVAEPEESLGKLKELRAYGKDKDARVAKLAMLTQLSVFADIIPGYRIRELTDKERTMKVGNFPLAGLPAAVPRIRAAQCLHAHHIP